MAEHYIEIPKSARYSTLGELTQDIQKVWIVCHGYGYLAHRFIRSFDKLASQKVLIIAPEGLHRYYLNGFSGNVGASWMTKEDRLHDIKDYVTFLDAIYMKIFSDIDRSNVIVNVLGFSQGTATVCRWLCQGKSKIDNLVLWGGPIPEDIKSHNDIELINQLNLKLVIGNKDEFVSEENLQEHIDYLSSLKIDYQLIRYDGTHKIDATTLCSLNI